MKLKTLVPKVAVVVAVGSYLTLGTHPVKAGLVSPALVAKQSQALNAFRPLPLFWGGFVSAVAGGALANSSGSPVSAALGAAGGAIAYSGANYFDNGGYDADTAAASAAVDDAAEAAGEAYYGNYYDTVGLTTLAPNVRALD
jgi:hypothetical protein